MYDREVAIAVQHWSRALGVPIDPVLVHAVIEKESRHGRAGLVAREPDGDYSYGPMMVKGLTAKTVLKITVPLERLKEPATGIWFGTQYLGQMLKRFPGDVERAISAYNAGPGNAFRNARRLFPNQSYVSDVLSFWKPAGQIVPVAVLVAVGLIVMLMVGRRPRARFA